MYFFQNKTSSRSHALMQLTIEQRWMEVEETDDGSSTLSTSKASLSKSFDRATSPIRKVRIHSKGEAI